MFSSLYPVDSDNFKLLFGENVESETAYLPPKFVLRKSKTNLASLIAGQMCPTTSVFLEQTPDGAVTSSDFELCLVQARANIKFDQLESEPDIAKVRENRQRLRSLASANNQATKNEGMVVDYYMRLFNHLAAQYMHDSGINYPIELLGCSKEQKRKKFAIFLEEYDIPFGCESDLEDQDCIRALLLKLHSKIPEVSLSQLTWQFFEPIGRSISNNQSDHSVLIPANATSAFNSIYSLLAQYQLYASLTEKTPFSDQMLVSLIQTESAHPNGAFFTLIQFINMHMIRFNSKHKLIVKENSDGQIILASKIKN